MGWKDNLRNASFKGADFRVENIEGEVGRKTATHDFPNRDIDYVEDLGRATRKFDLTAYFVGNDYDIARDKLMVVLEESGPGKFVHPYWGEFEAVLIGVARIGESQSDGRFATVTFRLSESQEPTLPLIVEITQSALLTKLNAAFDTIKNVFETLFNLADAAQSAVDKTKAAANNSALAIQSLKVGARKKEAFQKSLKSLPDNIDTLLNAPGELAQVYIDLFSADSSIEAIRENLLFSDYNIINPSTVEQENLLTNFIADSGTIGTCISVVNSEFTDVQQAENIKKSISDAIDLRMNYASNDVYDTLHDLRGALIDDINTRSAKLPKIISKTLNASLPSLFLSNDYYETNDMDTDIVVRNNVEHPGFIPGGVPLELLTND